MTAAMAASIAIGSLQIGVIAAEALVGLLVIFVVADVIERRAA